MPFKSLGLDKALLRAIDKKGYTEPSPIQEKAIPEVLAGNDVLASAQTGTGKTAGFTLPMLQILSKGGPQRRPQIRGLVLTPTRELAAQVQDNIREYGEFLHLRSMVMFGGVNQNPQVRSLKQGVDILVATPGRLIDLQNQGFVDLSNVEIFVLDEADRMLDMGFLRDIERVMRLLPKQRQSLMFSATFSRQIRGLAYDILNNPVQVEATPENSTAELVAQKAFRIDQREKVNFVIKLIGEGDWSQVLIFTRTKHRANRLAEKLVKSHITAAAIHGNKTQNARTKALKEFKEGKIRVLVATDIAARGLDIPLLPHVINFELPNVPEDYVHRIGRTGRAGASGEAISLVDVTEIGYLKDIEKLMGVKVKTTEAEGFEPSDKIPEGAIPPKPKKKPPRGGWKNKGGGSSKLRGQGGNSRGGGGKTKRSGSSSGNQSRGRNSGGSGSRSRGRG